MIPLERLASKLTNAILRREFVPEPDVEVEDSIIIDYTKKSGAGVKRVIVDRYNTIEAVQRIGYEFDADCRPYDVTDSGIVIVSKGTAFRERRAFLLTRARKQ